jgi:hypothetical protein
VAPQCTGTQQRIQVGAMIRMPVADQHRVNISSVRLPQQPRQDGVSGVDEEPETIVRDQVPAAGLSCRWPTPRPPSTVSCITSG